MNRKILKSVMKRLLAVVGMMLAAALAPAWAAAEAQKAETGKTSSAKIAWGEAVNDVQIGLVPLGGAKAGGWGEAQNLFFCPKCANKPRKHCMAPSSAAAGRVCAVCQTPKPWSATFVEGAPMRLELHVRNLAKEERSLYDVRYGNEYWQFTFTSVGGGKVWKTSWPIEDERTIEWVARSTVRLGGGEQDAVEMGLERYSLDLVKPDEGQPANRTLPPGKYTVTASYAHPGKYAVHGDPDSCGGHEQGKPCPYWRGTATTCPVEIEIRQKVGYQVDWTASATAEYEKAVKLLGRNGFAVIRNKAEEKVFMDRLELAGIKASFEIGNRPSEPWANFERGMQVVCWRDLTAADSLRITGVQQTAGGGSGKRDKFRLDLEVKQNNANRNVRAWQGCCVWIPRVNVLEVPGIGKEEIWTADKKGRDVADGLQACLEVKQTEVKQTAIKPGDDITLNMTLRNLRPAGGDAITVWDNKYSNGYRADFYLVVAPDGQSRILRRSVQEAWRKNAPTPITIEPGKSWTLDGVRYGENTKSLKAIGLDSSKQGIYTITGYYEADGSGEDRGDRARGCWGGQIATPPVEVRVGGGGDDRFTSKPVAPDAHLPLVARAEEVLKKAPKDADAHYFLGRIQFVLFAKTVVWEWPRLPEDGNQAPKFVNPRDIFVKPGEGDRTAEERTQLAGALEHLRQAAALQPTVEHLLGLAWAIDKGAEFLPPATEKLSPERRGEIEKLRGYRLRTREIDEAALAAYAKPFAMAVKGEQAEKYVSEASWLPGLIAAKAIERIAAARPEVVGDRAALVAEAKEHVRQTEGRMFRQRE